MNLTTDMHRTVRSRTRPSTSVRATAWACAALAAGLTSVAEAADTQVGVAGALDQRSAEKAFPAQRPYSPYVGAKERHRTSRRPAAVWRRLMARARGGWAG